MQIVNQIGHIQHWGLTPAVNILQKFNYKQNKEKNIKILISGCSDIRHILKTLSDSMQKITQQRPKLQIYLHETSKQLLCRSMLFLHIIHETKLNFQERIQIFLDLFGNAMIKNARYLHNLKEDILNFIHQEKNIKTPIKNFINLKLLKFQERDQLSEIVQSWSIKVPFDMQKNRDTKLRALFKQRYDYRANLIDWDYNMLLTECAPIIHYYHYKQWRMTGLAYQQRFSKYTQPNRTLSSWVPGRKKQQRTSCLVRGYWGDIIISPYIALGVRCDYHQQQLLFKKANLKYIGHSVQIAEYNMNYWLHQIQKGQRYTRFFRDYYRCDEETKKKLEEKSEQKKKEKERKKKQLPQIKEENQQIKQQQSQISQNKQKPENINKNQKQEILDSDEQIQKAKVQKLNQKQIEYQPQEKQLLFAFKQFGVSIHLMAMPHEKLISKKFQSFFDIIMLGFTHTAYLTKNITNNIKQNGLLIAQKATYLIPKKKQERKQLNTKLQQLIQKTKLKKIDQTQNVFTFINQ